MYPETIQQKNALNKLIRNTWQPLKKIAIMLRTSTLTPAKFASRKAQFKTAAEAIITNLDN